MAKSILSSLLSATGAKKKPMKKKPSAGKKKKPMKKKSSGGKKKKTSKKRR